VAYQIYGSSYYGRYSKVHRSHSRIYSYNLPSEKENTSSFTSLVIQYYVLLKLCYGKKKIFWSTSSTWVHPEGTKEAVLDLAKKNRKTVNLFALSSSKLRCMLLLPN